MEERTSPKILIIAHNCFSLSGSNGRTLGNFFQGYPKDKLAQLYVVEESPNYEICDNYLQITDRDVLKGNIPFSKAKGEIKRKDEATLPETPNDGAPQGKRIKRTARTALLREMVWSSPFWSRKKIRQWINAFQPDVILFQAGTLGYLCALARRIAKKNNIPLVVYNSESYFLKEFNFFDGTLKRSLSFRLYMCHFRKCFSKMMKRTLETIYISKYLQEAYREKFSGLSSYVMTSYSDNLPLPDKEIVGTNKIKIAYIGNLDLGRHQSLIKIASVLEKIDKTLELTVYGKAERDETIAELKAQRNINYCGVIPYFDVLRIISGSDINLLVEGFDPYFVEDSKYAFSTKIADILASGKCALCYAPTELTFVKYLEENDAACIVTQETDLEEKLRSLIFQASLRATYANNAKGLALKNHNSKTNKEKFWSIVGKNYENHSN